MDELEMARQCAAKMWDDDFAARALGISIEIPAVGCAEALMEVSQKMVNGHDICHGGYIFLLADTAFAFACNAYNEVTVAASANIEFLRPGKLDDELVAKAKQRFRGGRTGLYNVVVTNQHDEEIAIFRGRSHATRAKFFD